MAPKRKGKKCKNPIKEKHTEKIEKDLIDFETAVQVQIEEIQLEADNLIQKTINQYDYQLKLIPEGLLNMTLNEIDALQNKTPNAKEISPNEGASALNVVMNKLKSMREQRTLSSKPKKKMVSVMSNIKNQSIVSAPHKRVSSEVHLKALSHKAAYLNQTTSSPYKCTPVVKSTFGLQQKRRLIKNSLAVTPKFDPKTPLSTSVLRKPKVGETIMSLSGSPLQNTVSNPEKPSVLLSLPDGKVLNILEPTELQKLRGMQLDEETKATLLSVQQKLAGILV